MELNSWDYHRRLGMIAGFFVRVPLQPTDTLNQSDRILVETGLFAVWFAGISPGKFPRTDRGLQHGAADTRCVERGEGSYPGWDILGSP